jgi:hypothetical protein
VQWQKGAVFAGMIVPCAYGASSSADSLLGLCWQQALASKRPLAVGFCMHTAHLLLQLLGAAGLLLDGLPHSLLRRCLKQVVRTNRKLHNVMQGYW